MNILLFCQTRVLADKIALTVFEDVLGQTFQAFLAHHPLDDFFDKGRQALERTGELFRVAVDRAQRIDIDIRFPLVWILQNIINIENITEYAKLENMRKEFVANVSHELKTPITSIQGFIETLKMTDNLDEDTKNRFLTIIENEATRLTRLIDDILLLSTIENKTKKKVEKVDLFEVFEEVHEVINYIAKKKNIKVKYDFENKDIDLWEYSGYIRQILLNIISNAIKYTGENGKVSIKQYIKSEKVFIEVKDNGIGIPEEDIERIFERFYRVDKARSRSVGGTGLGLAITKHMVKALNGNIKVESELGVGSKFIIELPFNTELAKKVS